LTRDARRQAGIPNRVEGALVIQVDEGCNAYEAGLREGDVIVEFNHRPVRDADALVEASDRAQEDKILLRVWSQRGGMPGLTYLVVDNTKGE
jgi:S1-C subfamily serine protease